MANYRKLDKEGKPVGRYSRGASNKPMEGANRYVQDTPTFESLVTKGGQGTRGDKTFAIGAKEYERNKKTSEKKQDSKDKPASKKPPAAKARPEDTMSEKAKEQLRRRVQEEEMMRKMGQRYDEIMPNPEFAKGGAVKKEDKDKQNDLSNRRSLLEERERLLAQREKLKRPGRNIFEIAASRGVARPLRAGSMEDKTQVMDGKYVRPGQGDKDAAAAWDSRMNYLESRIEDVNKQLKRRPDEFAMGGMAQKKVGKVMKEYKAGTLHSGKGGKVVKNPKQAVAIAMSEARQAKKK